MIDETINESSTGVVCLMFCPFDRTPTWDTQTRSNSMYRASLALRGKKSRQRVPSSVAMYNKKSTSVATS